MYQCTNFRLVVVMATLSNVQADEMTTEPDIMYDDMGMTSTNHGGSMTEEEENPFMLPEDWPEDLSAELENMSEEAKLLNSREMLQDDA
jgi:hypothetical protein